jgi:predicted NACHT family NTPase
VSLIHLDQLIKAIIGIVSPTAFLKNKLQRNEIVIKLLKQFNLDPEHPPVDFSGVYAYALVEYGVGKPKQFLELFRQEEIKQAFRKAFDHNNPSILFSEVDTFIDAYTLGDEIRNLGIDIKREVAAFATVFIEVAKRSRTPADVLMNQQIGSMHKRIASIQENLERLPTLEGIRTEMARLAEQGDPALLEISSSTEKRCRAIALAQQMRGWFETLGYRFEKYEVWENNYFEWIINIPVRRNRYDRILVRGIEGEARLSDMMALRQSVEQKRTDEGWLVAARRISQAVRDEVEKEENHCLACYTFDELIDQDADLSGYLDWLEAEVIRREIDKKYVPLACTKEEFDPVSKRMIGVSRYDERNDCWIDGYIDLWLDDPSKEHISILGEFGTGKTWFAFRYAWTALQHYREAKKKGVERPRLPLIIPLRDYAKAVSVESLFSEFFFRKHEIPLPGYSAFEQLNRMGKLLLIFDGFDEMAARVDRQEMINNFWELAKVVVPGAKVILTCRTEHFPEAKEGRSLLNAELQASTANLTGETPQFEVVELEKFNDDQIRKVLSFQVESTMVKQIMSNSQLLELLRRPVMAELILEALPDIEAGKPVDMSRIYLYAARRKMERDIKAERTFTSLADKLYFLCELSWEMLSTDQMSLNYRLFPDRIRHLFGGFVQEEKDLDHWHYDMMGQTMLIRNADGDYAPAHRSFLEFFVAYKFAAELGVLADDFTELAQAQSHLNESGTHQYYTWSSYFRRQINEGKKIEAINPLKAFRSESLDHLRQTFGRARLTKAVMDLLLPMLDIHCFVTSSSYHPVIKILEATKGKTEEEASYLGGNGATVLVKVDKRALEGFDLSHSVIKGADFTNASLRGVNFTEANLGDSNFTEAFGFVLTVAYSPDGQLFATGEADGGVRLWQVATSQQILSFKGHTSWVSSVTFSPDAKFLASGSHDNTVKIWDIQTGKCLKILTGHTEVVRSVDISLDGKTLASGSDDCTIKIWDFQTGKCLKTLQGHSGRVWAVVINPDGRTIASSSSDQTVKIWNISTGECLHILQEHTSQVASLAISRDNRTLVSGSNDCTIKIWNFQTGECLKTLQGHSTGVWTVAVDSSGTILASGSNDQTIKIWDVSTGECLKILQGHTHNVLSVAINPKTATLVSSSKDQTVKFWDIRSGECFKTLQGFVNWINSLATIPGTTTIASGCEDGSITLWNIRTGERLKSFQAHTEWVNSLAASSDGKVIASCGGDGCVKLWDVHTSKCLRTFQMDRRAFAVAISPDGTILASGGNGNKINLWNLDTGKLFKTLDNDLGVEVLIICPDNITLISGQDGALIKAWDIYSGKCLKTFHGHSGSVWSLSLSPDGKNLASGSNDHTVRLWDLSTGECLGILREHTSHVNSVVFSADGKLLASGSGDETIRLWDLNSKECIKILQGHANRVQSVTFLPDNSKTLLSGSYDGTIKFWDVSTGECLKTLIDRPYEGMNISNIKGLKEAEKASLKALGAVEDRE